MNNRLQRLQTLKEQHEYRVKHLPGKHPQKRHAGGRGGSGGGGGGAAQTVMSTVESIAGRGFKPEASKTIGNRTSNLMNISLGSEPHRNTMKKLDEAFAANGMKKYPGKTRSETVYGNADKSIIANVTKRSRTLGGRRKSDKKKRFNSLLVEVIAKD